MWFKSILLLLLCAPRVLLAGEAHFSNFGGVNNFNDSMLIDDRDAQDANNVLTDEGDLRTIYGNLLYSVVGSSSIAFFKEWVNTSGQRVLYVQAGYTLYATDPSSGTISSIKYFGADYDIDMVAAFNRAYFTDGTNNPFYSTGSSTTVTPGMEDCKYVESYQTRLVCVNTSTDTSKVYLSAYNAPTDWAVTSSKDSAAIKYFKKDDGEGINCVYSTPEGLFIGKDNSVGMLKGSDNETFYWYYIASDVGCSDDRTVQLVDGELVWLTKNGYYSYDFGGIPKPISIKVKTSTDLIRRSNSADSVWTVNTMSNWQDGTGDGWEYNIVPGSIKAEAYNSGSTTTHNAALVHAPTNAGFNAGSLAGWTTPAGYTPALYLADYDSQVGGIQLAGEKIGPYWAYMDIGSGQTNVLTVKILKDSDKNVVEDTAVITAPYNGCTIKTFTGITSAYPVSIALIDVAFNGILQSTYTYSSGFTAEQGMVSIKACNYFGNIGGGHPLYFDIFDSSIAYITPATGPFDTGLTSPIVTATAKGTQISTVLTYSADNTTYSSTPARYLKYQIQFSSGVAISSFTSITLSVLSTTAYTSAVQHTADDISAWKLFTVSNSGTATPIYSVRAATYAFASDAVSPTFTTQPKNATMAVSTGSYVQFQVNPNIATSTDSLTVNSVSIAYSVGQLSPRAASLVSDHRYVASVSHNSSTENDITYIWQKNKEWTFSDQGYGALGIFNNKPMGGSTDSVSKLWYILDPTALSFDGTAINSYWTTKDFTLGAINNHKVIDRLWINADNNGLADFGIAWQANRDGVWNSTTTPLNASGFTIKEVDGLFESQYPARQIRFKFSASELSKIFKLKLFSLYFRVNDLIKD